jgi:List-Bact-rpt repeat protein
VCSGVRWLGGWLLSVFVVAVAVLALTGGPAQAQSVTLSIHSFIDATGTVTSSPAGISCTTAKYNPVEPCSATFPVGTVVTLTAVPGEQNTFEGWTGGGCSGLGTCQVTMTEDIEVRPNFVATRYPVTIVPEGNGDGIIQETPGETFGTPRLACVIRNGRPDTEFGTCAATVAYNSVITLTFENSITGTNRLVGYSAECQVQNGADTCKARITGPTTITATIVAAEFRVKSAGGTGTGTVTSNVAEINCTVTSTGVTGGCGKVYTRDGIQQVNLIATPAAGSRFVGWSGACTADPCTLSPDYPPHVPEAVALFEMLPETSPLVLTVVDDGTGRGTVRVAPGSTQCTFNGIVADDDCSATFSQPTEVTLTATPQFGSTFGGWTADGCSSAHLTCTFTLAAAKTVSVNFISPHSAHDLGLALIGGATLSPNDRAGLDRLGNQNGVYDLGDLLAYLDRTGQKLTATEAAAVMATPLAPSAARTTRRVP